MSLIPELNLEISGELAAILEYYETSDESVRLQRLESELELLRTRDILARNLPPAPAEVLDIGGGPAVHSYWLSSLGHRVHLIDLVPKHIETAKHMASRFPGTPLTSLNIGDARKLEFPDHSLDVVVMLGPLYHLVRSADRHTALREAWRVLHPGGTLIVEAISRYLPLVKVLTREMLTDARMTPIVARTLHTGQHRPDPDLDFFTKAFFHHPSGLKREVTRAGFVPGNLFAVEGPVRLLKDFGKHWQIRERREWLLDLARQLEHEQVLLGVSGHMILTAIKPNDRK